MNIATITFNTYLIVEVKGKPRTGKSTVGLVVAKRYMLWARKEKSKNKPQKVLDKSKSSIRTARGKEVRRIISRKRDVPINQVFKKKPVNIIINDILSRRGDELKQDYKRLFSKAIYNESMLNIMLEDSNIEKIKGDMEIKAWIYGRDGKELYYMNKDGASLIELKNMIYGRIWKGKDIGNPSDEKWVEDMRQMGWNIAVNSDTEDNNIDRMEVKIILRG